MHERTALAETPALDDVAARAIAEAERQAERTAGWMRLIVGLSLGSLLVPLALNPQLLPNPEIAGRVRLGMATVSAFLVLAVLTLLVSRPGVYRQWHAWAFMTADIMLIGINSYFALAGSGLGFEYVMAMPPVWMVPILLAIGAMRFRPQISAYGTALAVLILGSMALQAPGHSDSMLTSMFALPPNILRLAMLALAGGILAYAAARNSALMRGEIAEARRAANLTRYLPPEIAGRLAQDVRRVRRGERRFVAVMFVDLRGFTGFAEHREAEIVSRFLAAYRARVTAILKLHGGMVDKFIGDGVMAVFGASGDSPRDDLARRALAGAEAVAGDMARWDGDGLWPGAPPIPVAIGLHAGEAFCGAVGDDERLEFSVLGDTVNVAARLEQLAKSMGATALVSAQTLDGIGSPGPRWRELAAQEVRGHAAPITVWSLG